MRLYRKIYLIMLMVLMTICLTGCDKLPASVFVQLPAIFDQRIEQNRSILAGLYSNGFIDEQTKNQLSTDLDNAANFIKNDLAGMNKSGNVETSEENTKKFGGAVVYWRCVDYSQAIKDMPYNTAEEREAKDAAKEAWNKKFLTNSANILAGGWGWTKEWEGNNATRTVQGFFNSPALDGSMTQITPLILISDGQSEDLMKRLAFNVYVLKEGADIPTLHAYLSGVDPTNDETFDRLDNFFKPVLDKDGSNVPLIDITNPDNILIKDSVGAYIDSNNDNVRDRNGVQDNSIRTPDGNIVEQPGYDMGVRIDSELILRVRLKEFNKKAYDAIVSRVGLTEETYMVLKDSVAGSSGAAYLLQYPVGYISGFKIDDSGSTTTYEPEIKLSKMAVNIKTGRIIKQETVRHRNDPTTTTASGLINGSTPQICSNVEQYLIIALDKPDSSSFVVSGKTGLGKIDEGNWNLAFGDQGICADIPRIVLTDYLELSYSPGIVDNEDIVAYGRKFRFDKDRWSGTLTSVRQPVAFYCSKDGVKPGTDDEARWLYLDDLCDYNALNQGVDGKKPYVKRLPGIDNEALSDATVVAELDSADKGDAEVKKTEDLDIATVSSINTTLEFPGGTVDKIDVDKLWNTEIPFFYAMTVCKNFGESGLVKWITSTEETESFTWWVRWLKDHDFKYGENLKESAMEEFLNKNYQYELAESGLVIIDLETVAKIQQEMDKESSIKTSRTIRTIFKIFGYLLVSYGFILMMCWAIDTNVDLGLGLLEKASFKSMVAVVDSSEIPQGGDDHIRYTDFEGILIIGVIMIATGLLFIFVDIMILVTTLIDTVGKIAQSIGKLFGG